MAKLRNRESLKKIIIESQNEKIKNEIKESQINRKRVSHNKYSKSIAEISIKKKESSEDTSIGSTDILSFIIFIDFMPIIFNFES